MANLIKEPKTVDDIVFADAYAEKRIRQYVTGKRHNNILLHGPMGTGKSATAKIIAEARRGKRLLDYPTPVYNGATFDDTFLNRIMNEWALVRNDDAAYVIIDEVDRLSKNQQVKLRAFLDGTKLGHIIMTTNNLHNIDPPLADRCDVIEFPAIDATQWLDRINVWLEEANITATEEQIRAVIDTNTGTIRDLIDGVEDIILEYK